MKGGANKLIIYNSTKIKVDNLDYFDTIFSSKQKVKRRSNIFNFNALDVMTED